MLPLFPSPSFFFISQLEDNFKVWIRSRSSSSLTFWWLPFALKIKLTFVSMWLTMDHCDRTSPATFLVFLDNFSLLHPLSPFFMHAVPCAWNALSTFFFLAHTYAEVIASGPTPWKDFFLSKTGPLTYHLIRSLSIILCHSISFSLKHNNM